MDYYNEIEVHQLNDDHVFYGLVAECDADAQAVFYGNGEKE